MAWLDQSLRCTRLGDQRQGDLENVLKESVGMGTMCMSLWVNATAQSLSHSKASK